MCRLKLKKICQYDVKLTENKDEICYIDKKTGNSKKIVDKEKNT
jgi:hypothetical protein